jgi:hypothetical protein
MHVSGASNARKVPVFIGYFYFCFEEKFLPEMGTLSRADQQQTKHMTICGSL